VAASQPQKGVTGVVLTNAIKEALAALENQHGRLTAELVVDAARAEDHPLHDCLWRNQITARETVAREHRLGRVRDILRCAKVKTVHTGKVIHVPAYDRDPVVLTRTSDPRAGLLAEIERVEQLLARVRELAEQL
jgi:hypothetical protein